MGQFPIKKEIKLANIYITYIYTHRVAVSLHIILLFTLLCFIMDSNNEILTKF